MIKKKKKMNIVFFYLEKHANLYNFVKYLLILLIIFIKVILEKNILKIKQMLWPRLFHSPPIHRTKSN